MWEREPGERDGGYRERRLVGKGACMEWSGVEGNMGRTVIPYIDNSNGGVASCGSFLRGKEEFGERGCREALEGADCGHSGFLK